MRNLERIAISAVITLVIFAGVGCQKSSDAPAAPAVAETASAEVKASEISLVDLVLLLVEERRYDEAIDLNDSFKLGAKAYNEGVERALNGKKIDWERTSFLIDHADASVCELPTAKENLTAALLGYFYAEYSTAQDLREGNPGDVKIGKQSVVILERTPENRDAAIRKFRTNLMKLETGGCKSEISAETYAKVAGGFHKDLTKIVTEKVSVQQFTLEENFWKKVILSNDLRTVALAARELSTSTLGLTSAINLMLDPTVKEDTVIIFMQSLTAPLVQLYFSSSIDALEKITVTEMTALKKKAMTLLIVNNAKNLKLPYTKEQESKLIEIATPLVK